MSIATLDWLNSITDEEFQFFGLECELWRIGASQPAPKFNIVSNLTIGADKSPRRLSVSKPRTSATRKRPSLSSGLDLWNFLVAGKARFGLQSLSPSIGPPSALDVRGFPRRLRPCPRQGDWGEPHHRRYEC